MRRMPPTTGIQWTSPTNGEIWRRSERPRRQHEGGTTRGEIGGVRASKIGRRRRGSGRSLSRDAAIPRLGRTLVAFGTTTVRGLPSEVLLEPGDDPVSRTTAINLDSIETVSLGALVERMGRLSDWRSDKICAAIQVAVGCPARLSSPVTLAAMFNGVSYQVERVRRVPTSPAMRSARCSAPTPSTAAGELQRLRRYRDGTRDVWIRRKIIRVTASL